MSLKLIDLDQFQESSGINSVLGDLLQDVESRGAQYKSNKGVEKNKKSSKQQHSQQQEKIQENVMKNTTSESPSSLKKNQTISNSTESLVTINDEFTCMYIGNIPKDFRSADLRLFFSEFIEKSAFECFHFRHRPETSQIKDNGKSENDYTIEDNDENTTCCMVKCKKKYFERFKKKYHKRQWSRNNKTFCNIFKMNVGAVKSKPSKKYLNNKESKDDNHDLDQDIYLEDFSNLIEFDPPVNVMPQGNVGTPTKTFHAQIKNCTLPSSIIRSLGLSFNKTSKKYATIEMDYKTTFKKFNHPSDDEDESKEDKSDSEREKTEDKPEDGDAEEWDRYNALHDDVDNQSRPKERLFEEDLELKWEKGGSGLVFYTDSYFWNEMKGKDFDEDTVDDWDVDYNVYYEDGAGDKASRDQLRMRIEKRRREGKPDGPNKYTEIRQKEKTNRKRMIESFAEFEKHSNAIGSRILKRHGWSEGDGVGSSKQGIKEPVILQGQLPRKKVGLGFYGEKLDTTVGLKKPRLAENDVYISTIYDPKDGEHVDAMRFHGKDLLKYRTPKIEFRKPSATDTSGK